MAYGRRQRKRVGRGQPAVKAASNRLLQRWVQALAVLGLGVSAYLTYLHYNESTAALCAEGSGCDIVRSSSYSTVMGNPVALLGVVGFALVLGISFSRLSPFRKGLSLYLLALAGVTFSAYLTYLEVAVINAICSYCVASASLMAGILLLLLLQRPLMPRLSADSVRLYSGLVMAVVLLGSIVACRGTDDGAGGVATPYQVALAQHLTAERDTMYGAYWCPHCAEQKKLFGNAFDYVNYVECDPKGKDANPALCQQKGIGGFPTWEIGNDLYEGTRSLQELARLSGFSP